MCLVWSTPQIVLWKAMVLWRMELHRVSSGCPILKGLLKIHISVSSIASFHSAGCRQQVLATAWSSIWLMEAHSPGTYWCLTPALLKDDSWARRLCSACWTPCSLICALPTRENWAPRESSCDAPLCEGSFPPTNSKCSPTQGGLNRGAKFLWIFSIEG